MSACILGCRIRGEHKPEGAEPPCPGETCPGCLPRPAAVGTLCAWCYQRLTADVADLPSLLAHLDYVGRPNAGHQAGGDGRTGGDPANRTILHAAWLTADEIETWLCGWVEMITEERGLRGPAMRWTLGGRRREAGESWIVDPHPVAAQDMRALVRWLTPHLEWVAGRDWAGDFRRELGKAVATAKARWPMVERGHAVPAPCPRCDGLTLWYSPPVWAGGPMRVECLDPECGRIFAEDEWERMRALMVIAAGRAG